MPLLNHAFQFLKLGGKLITLAHHYQLKPSSTDKAFFAWLKSNHAFPNSDRPTAVPLQIIFLTKS